jgi:hypothetical protein
MKHPDKPELYDDPRKTRRSPTSTCPECEEQHDKKDMIRGREQIGKDLFRMDYWCPETEVWVGVNVDYEGPVPVRTHTGWEMH